jgi:Co/Zn/Cd efflux system component
MHNFHWSVRRRIMAHVWGGGCGGEGGGRHREEIGVTDNVPGVLSPRPPSNEKLLCTAFVSFQCFAILQTITAVWAGSEAMMADAAAMIVDAFSYLFNWFAERQKQFNATKLSQRGLSTLYILEYRRSTYQLELVTPLLSISTLLVLTGFMLNKSIRTLVMDSKRDVSEQADPNVKLMFIMSVLNLMLDMMNVLCFASSKLASAGYSSTNRALLNSSHADHNMDGIPTSVQDKADVYSEDDEEIQNLSHDNSFEDRRKQLEEEYDDSTSEVEIEASLMKPLEMEAPTGSHETSRDEENHKSNLNMCSAFTVRTKGISVVPISLK